MRPDLGQVKDVLIRQLARPGQLEEKEMPSSSTFLLKLKRLIAELSEQEGYTVGLWAREQGSLNPSR